jgi:hypothetical protein
MAPGKSPFAEYNAVGYVASFASGGQLWMSVIIAPEPEVSTHTRHRIAEESGRSLTYNMQILQSPDMMSAERYGLRFI